MKIIKLFFSIILIQLSSCAYHNYSAPNQSLRAPTSENNDAISRNDIAIDENTCKDLANEVSISAFSPDNNGILYQAAKLYSEKGSEYIDSVRKELQKELHQACSERSLVSLERRFNSTCGMSCQNHKDIFYWTSQQNRADTACLTICNNSNVKLRMFRMGITAR